MAKKEKRNIEIKGNVSESIVGDNNHVVVNKNQKHKCWAVIVGIFTILSAIATIKMCVSSDKNSRDVAVKSLRQDAINSFEKKEFDSAFNMFYELKKETPNDSCGYYLFLNKAKEMLKYGGYDDNICGLLEKANKLQNTKEVNDLLKNCK